MVIELRGFKLAYESRDVEIQFEIPAADNMVIYDSLSDKPSSNEMIACFGITSTFCLLNPSDALDCVRDHAGVIVG